MALYRCGTAGGSGGGNLTDRAYDGTTMLEANKYCDANGSIANYNGWSLTDYIDVGSSTEAYVFSTMANGQVNAAYTACYDATKTPLRVRATVLGGLVTFPSGTRYVRFSDATTFMSGLKVILEV